MAPHSRAQRAARSPAPRVSQWRLGAKLPCVLVTISPFLILLLYVLGKLTAIVLMGAEILTE